MRNQPSYIKLTNESRKEIEQYARGEGWQIVGKENLPSFIPDGMREKVDSVIIITQGTPSGTTIFVGNAYRVEPRAKAIDMEPFITMVLPDGDWKMEMG